MYHKNATQSTGQIIPFLHIRCDSENANILISCQLAQFYTNRCRIPFWEVLAVLQMMDTTGGDTQLQEQFAEDALPWLQTLKESLAFPRLREPLEQATPKEWEQARIDYVTLCQFFRNFFAPVAHKHPVPEEMYVLLFASGGFYLVPVALAIRYWGRGDWNDDA